MEFSELLLKARLASGFSSPKHYYEHLGGQKVLGITYEYYYKIEKGEILPKSDKAVLLVRKAGSVDIQDALYAYVRDLMPDAVTKSFFPRLKAQEGASEESYTKELEQTVAYYKSKLSHGLSEAELQFVTKDADHFRVFLFFLLNAGSFTCEEVGMRAWGAGEASGKLWQQRVGKTTEVVAGLVRLGLAAREEEGKYRGLYHEADFTRCPEYVTKYKKLVYDYDDRLAEGGKELLHQRGWRLSNSGKMKEVVGTIRELFKRFSVATDLVNQKNNDEAYCLSVKLSTRPSLSSGGHRLEEESILEPVKGKGA